jgi:hypothetical protein
MTVPLNVWPVSLPFTVSPPGHEQGRPDEDACHEVDRFYLEKVEPQTR